MSEKRVSKRNKEKGTSRSLATIRVVSDPETVPVQPVIPDPPSEHTFKLLESVLKKTCNLILILLEVQ